ncbi:MAG: hypothetical protein ACRDTM_10555 [Micromonosporaceae bacterium]
MFEIEVKSHRYLRTAMVLLLVGLGVAVFYQTWRQGFELLGSVSAYYYTPAQAIFVGALIGLGACMIALKGTTDVEDVFLNLGGMFAAVVAIVPITRGEDYTTAVRACEQTAGPLLTERASIDLDCPTVRALADATRANVENNMVALLVVGALGLLATVFFALRDSRSSQPGSRQKFWWGFVAAFLVYAVGAAAFWASTEWFVDRAHYIAGGGLFACVVVVAVANAVRHQDEQRRQLGGAPESGRTLRAVPGAMRRPDRYAWLAWAMVAVAVVGGVLVFVNAFALFWFEILVALLFALFWLVQTIEQLGHEPQPSPES